MLIIPEIESVLILVPRSGSTSFKEAVMKKYPESILLYRHMEADGVPRGYDSWDKYGVARQPIDRLWSLFKLLSTFDGPYDKAYINTMRRSVEKISFSDWIINNQTVFTIPYDFNGSLKIQPKYMVGHSQPETRKSQYIYLRPDLGTNIYKFTELDKLADRLDVKLQHLNGTDKTTHPQLTEKANKHINKFFSWDINNS